MNVKLNIDFDSQIPIFQQIVNEVERKILIGELREDDLLKSVRQVAVENTINPNTVAKAYQTLQTMGLVESVRGKGLRVKRLKSKTALTRRDDLITEKISELLTFADSLNVSSSELIELIKIFGVKK